ncbi:MAG: hypothetical protein Q7U51_07560 [Methanoregula sp.]|nr:hypothetical protein [Methanoregula sp.]
MGQFWSRIIIQYHIQKFNFNIWFRCKFLKLNDEEIKIITNETTSAVSDIVISQAPFIGPIAVRINDTGERVRQQHINAFLEKFVSTLMKIERSEIDWTRFTSKDFYFMIHSVTERVHHTTAKEKIHRFQEILIKDLKTTYNSDFKETYLDLILRLNEEQIKILRAFQKLHNDHGPILRHESADEKEKEHQRIRIQKIPKAEDFVFDRELYSFYIQDLTSKSLLYDDGMGRFGTGPFTIIDITKFGLEFLNFIEYTDVEE